MTSSDPSAQQEKFVRANGLDIYYEEYGSGQPLLLIHGGFSNHDMWQKHIPFFAPHFRVLTPDSRAHGRTKNPSGAMSWTLLADDMAAFVQALDLDQPFICGFSDGGQITLEIALHYPRLAKAYVAAGSSYRNSEAILRWVAQIGIEQPGVVNLELFERNEPDIVKTLQNHQDAFQGQGYWKSYLTQISSMWLAPLHYSDEEMTKIVEPLLLLAGDRDHLSFPLDDAVHMYRTIPRAELAIVTGAAHSIKVELFAALVLDFFPRQGS